MERGCEGTLIFASINTNCRAVGEGTKENSDGSDLEEDEDAHIPEEQAGPGASTQVLAEQGKVTCLSLCKTQC